MPLQSLQLRASLQAAHVNLKLILVEPSGCFHDLPLRAGVKAHGVT
jgi:hypothetical protein